MNPAVPSFAATEAILESAGLSTEALDATADLLLEVADVEILPRFRQLQPSDVRTKQSAIDLVTVADEAAERALTARLRAMFPGAIVLGEEAAASDPQLLDSLHGQALVILLDPVDGTRNFASGLGLFGVMAAFVLGGQVLASVICDPVMRDWAMAARGKGAWLRDATGGRRPLRASVPRPVGEMEGCGLWLHLAEPQRSRTAVGLTKFASNAAYRCAAHEYRLIAGGHYDFSLYHKIAPWDHAPGVLLHQEAGGYCAHLDGAGYDPRRSSGGLLCAADEASWLAIREALQLAPDVQPAALAMGNPT